MSNNYESGWLGNFEMWIFLPALKQKSFGNPIFDRGRFDKCIQPLTMGWNFVQMNARAVFDNFQSRIELFDCPE